MSSQINLIKPARLNNEEISCWFTLRNHDSVQQNKFIPGLNLGLNTDESASVVLENRKHLLEETGISENQIAYAVQIHETAVRYVDSGGIYTDTDGFVTDKKDLALAIQVADCAAVLCGDSKNKVIGVAHAGWRGAAGNIVPKTIQQMIALGAEANHIHVFISPCISLKNFEVGEEVAAEFPEEFVDRTNYSKPHVDLRAFIKKQLEYEGIKPKNIEIDDRCTIEVEEFYSYRRQKEKSGRMMGIIKLN
ncbi:MAG: peptidoglycan editing factor PgeF [Gracilimonas sp.]|uniref:peptidoglycan editing factor PgeF n=1 Tax=Gracilimonas sp. TaxID=1974203 RepID=UPI001993C52D|nr:peptidoglycan editing factor PgeF [Gracilimonas sp.]MBD3615795.1 peptidoglycan editing factor PgeF [Gracilimonas sp.]